MLHKLCILRVPIHNAKRRKCVLRAALVQHEIKNLTTTRSNQSTEIRQFKDKRPATRIVRASGKRNKLRINGPIQWEQRARARNVHIPDKINNINNKYTMHAIVKIDHCGRGKSDFTC